MAAFAYWGVEWLVSAAPPAIPRLNAIRLDATVFDFALGVSLCVAIGLTAVAALRHGGVDGAAAFAEGGRSSTVGLEQHRSGSALVVGQVALALLLVIGAGLLLESFRRLHAIDPGVDPDGVLTLEAYLPSDPYDGSEARWRFYDAVLQRVRALPGVTAAGVSANLPFDSDYGCTVQGFEDQDVYTRLDDQGLTTCASQTPTSPGYFEALSIPLVTGRLFTEYDNETPAAGAAIVSQAFAARFWPGENAIGKGVAPEGRTQGPFYRVVGVVGDVYASSVQEEAAIAIYYPISVCVGWHSVGRPTALSLRPADPGTLPRV